MFAKKIFILLFIGALCVGIWHASSFLFDLRTVVAQTTESSLADQENQSNDTKKSDVSPEIKEKAVKLLNAVARETEQFAAPSNRIKSRIVSADLLWDYDEPAARALFQNVLSELQTMLENLAVTVDEENKNENSDYSKRYAIGEMRREYLLALAARDPKAALVALSSLRLQTPSKKEYDPLKADELELQIASAVAEKDPQQAYELGAKSLRDGVTQNTMTTLADLHKNNPELGAKFAREILAKFKTSRLRPPPTNSNIARANTNANTSSITNYIDLSQLAQFITTAEQINRRAAGDKNKKDPVLTEAEMRELADFIGQSLSRQGTVEPWAIASSMPLIAKYSPTAAQMIKRKFNAQQVQTLETYSESSNYYEERENKTFDEIVSDADKIATAPERDTRYATAVQKALEKNELEKAVEIAGKIKDKTSYEYIFEELKTTAPVIKARRGDIAEVRKLLTTIKNDNEKVVSLTELVIALASKGETETAQKLIEEANQFLPARLKRQADLETTLKIGGAYALLQPERGFGLIENSIAQMNDLIAAGLLIDEFYEYGTTENDEVLFDTMERQGVTHLTNFVAITKILAATDFDRTVNLADKFTRPEIRIYVRLKIAQALLDPKAAESQKKMREQLQNEHVG